MVVSRWEYLTREWLTLYLGTYGVGDYVIGSQFGKLHLYLICLEDPILLEK